MMDASDNGGFALTAGEPMYLIYCVIPCMTGPQAISAHCGTASQRSRLGTRSRHVQARLVTDIGGGAGALPASSPCLSSMCKQIGHAQMLAWVLLKASHQLCICYSLLFVMKAQSMDVFR